MPSIRISSSAASFKSYEAPLRKAARITLDAIGAKGQGLDIRISSAAEIRRLNRKFLGANRATDVLSFGAREGDIVPAGEEFLGDVAVCFDIAKSTAAKFGNSILDELSLYLIHGILHLAGWDDVKSADKVEMEKIQNRILSKCKSAR